VAHDRRLLYLLQRATRAAIARANTSTLERLGVSVAQLGTLSYLAQRHGCTMTDVAALLDLNKPAVSAMLGRLERAHLIRRAPNPRDGRGTLLFLTAKGERVRLASRPVFQRAISEMVEGFTAGELEVVFRFLNVLVERCKPDSNPGDARGSRARSHPTAVDSTREER
jgi:MarR family transcriptional regulator, transcriptional regulator for hemolysin